MSVPAIEITLGWPWCMALATSSRAMLTAAWAERSLMSARFTWNLILRRVPQRCGSNVRRMASSKYFSSRVWFRRSQMQSRSSSRLTCRIFTAEASICFSRPGPLEANASAVSSWMAAPVRFCAMVSCSSAANRVRSFTRSSDSRCTVRLRRSMAITTAISAAISIKNLNGVQKGGPEMISMSSGPRGTSDV